MKFKNSTFELEADNPATLIEKLYEVAKARGIQIFLKKAGQNLIRVTAANQPILELGDEILALDHWGIIN